MWCVFVTGTGQGEHSHTVSSRLARLFTVFNIFSHSDSTLHTIYSRTIMSWLEEFPATTVEHYYEFTKVCSQLVVLEHDSSRGQLIFLHN